jgi:lipopolysaccharide heptosyltransferase I
MLKDSTKKATPKRILIVRLSSIGDVARTLPALTSLRRQFPKAHIAWAVEDKSSALIQGHPHLDEVIVFERQEISRLLRNPLSAHRGLLKILKFLGQISAGDFDLVLDFHGILKSGLIAVLAGAPARVGFARGYVKEFNYLFTNKKVCPSDTALPRVQRNLELVKPFVRDVNLLDRSILGLTTRHCDVAKTFLEKTFDLSFPLIAIHPGTSRRLKQWFPAQFAAVCDMLADGLHANVVLTWGPGERDQVEQIRLLARSKPAVAFFTKDLLELAALLQMCSLMITVDCGPMHIASLLGTPVVALFGPTDAKINAPYWQPNRVITSDVACRPCDENCQYAKCMEAIKPEKIFQAAAELLNASFKETKETAK